MSASSKKVANFEAEVKSIERREEGMEAGQKGFEKLKSLVLEMLEGVEDAEQLKSIGLFIAGGSNV